MTLLHSNHKTDTLVNSETRKIPYRRFRFRGRNKEHPLSSYVKHKAKCKLYDGDSLMFQRVLTNRVWRFVG